VAPAAPAAEERGDFLRGRAGFCGPVEDFQGAGGSTWPGGLSYAGLRRPVGLSVMGQGRGRERREKMMGLKREKQKEQGSR
jgi:hypothetical protein